MTWHLKDRELEKKLIALSQEFLQRLNAGVSSKRLDENYILVSFDREKLGNYLDGNELLFWMDELEEVPEYNPHGWNEYPKVTPPYNVMMRVETHTGQGYKLFYNHLGDGDFWSDPNYLLMPKAFSDDVTRFRPWNED